MRSKIGISSFLIFFFAPFLTFTLMEITITAPKNVIKDYYDLLDEHQISPEEFSSLSSECDKRQNANLIIISKALKAAGMPVVFDFIESPNTDRARALLDEGIAVISSQDFFSITFTDNVYMSPEIIARGRLIKGIYCLESNEDLLEISTLEELKQFSAVSLPHWKMDWLTLEQLELKELHSVSRYKLIFNLIHHRGVDFTLLEFPESEDLSRTFEDVTLIPVPDIMVSLNDSRHFMISKKHPDGERIHEALGKGLAILREEGFIEKLLTQVKVYRTDLDSWTILNKE